MTTSTTKPYDAEEIEAARKLFEGPWDFVWASTKIDDLPPMVGQEIAFAGRSNVGKSSLINALTRRNALARTSHTPGRTQQLNFFRQVEHEEPVGAGSQGSKRSREKPVPVYSLHAPTIVDMPGYGYAAVGKEKVAAWTRLIHDYLRGRSNLMRVYVLIDARHGPKANDETLMNELDKVAVSYQVVLTKGDKPLAAELEKVIARTRALIAKRPAAHPEIIVTSSEKGVGIDALRTEIAAIRDGA